MKSKMNSLNRSSAITNLILLPLLFFILTGCATPLTANKSALNSISEAEGIIIGSFKIELPGELIAPDHFWRVSLADTEWDLTIRKREDTVLKRMALSRDHSLSAIAGGEEVYFATKLPQGKYTIVSLTKDGFTSFRAALRINFEVKPGETTFIGNLLLTLPTTVNQYNYTNFLVDILDAQEKTVSYLKEKEGFELGEVVKGLMVDENRRIRVARQKRKMDKLRRQLPNDMNKDKYIELIKGENQETRITAAKNIFYNRIFVEEILDAVNDVVLDEFNINFSKKDSSDHMISKHIDAISWYCKILGYSNMSKYSSTLEKVLVESNNNKIKRYASAGLKQLNLSN